MTAQLRAQSVPPHTITPGTIILLLHKHRLLSWITVLPHCRISDYSTPVQNSGCNFSPHWAQRAFCHRETAHIKTGGGYARILIRCSSQLSRLSPKQHTAWPLCTTAVKASIHIVLASDGSTPSNQEQKKNNPALPNKHHRSRKACCRTVSRNTTAAYNRNTSEDKRGRTKWSIHTAHLVRCKRKTVHEARLTILLKYIKYMAHFEIRV